MLDLKLDEPSLQHNLLDRWRPGAHDDERSDVAEAAEVMLALLQIQSYARQLESTLSAAAAGERDEGVRDELLRQAQENRNEADEIEQALSEFPLTHDRIEALRTARSRELRKADLYQRLQRKDPGRWFTRKGVDTMLDIRLKKARLTHGGQVRCSTARPNPVERDQLDSRGHTISGFAPGMLESGPMLLKP